MVSLPTAEEISSEALDLNVEIKGVRFKNPIIVGSAGYAEDERGIRRWIGKGYAGIVGKSTSRMSLKGAPPPKVFWLDPQKSGIDGAEAHRNPGIEEMSRFMRNLHDEAKNADCRLLGSVSGQSVEEAVYVAKKYEEAGVSCIEVDAMCPSTGPHLGPQYTSRGKFWAQDVERSIELLKGLKGAVSIPVWFKSTAPLLFRIMDDLEKEVKPDAYSYTPENIPGIRIDIETGKPRFSGNTELLIAQKRKFMPRPTATGLLQLTVLSTALLRRRTEVPLVPSGGINSGADVLELMMVGANAVQVCTVLYRDQDVVQKMLAEIREHMRMRSYGTILEAYGKALKHIPFELLDLEQSRNFWLQKPETAATKPTIQPTGGVET